jgi:putative ABC transport system permease protein
VKAVPPGLAVWLLGRRLSPEWHEFVLGDLAEEFDQRSAVSPSAAWRWFWWQAIRCMVAPPPRQPAATAPIHSSGDSMGRTILADLNYAIRVLLRAPSFALAVIAVLALGIGANTAIFSIVNAVLLRPLPFEEPDHLVRLYHVPPQVTFPGMPIFPLSPANFYDWKRDARSFEEMALYRIQMFTLTGGRNPEAILAGAVGAGFFEALRAKPVLGRVFLAEEDTPGRSRVVIVSNGFWKQRFGSAPDVIGRSLTLDGQAYTIVGVMPPEFSMKAWSVTARDLWVPIALNDARRAVRDDHNESVIARLKSGVDISQANAELTGITKRLELEFPQANTGWGGVVRPLQSEIVGDIRRSLLTLLAAVALVLLIACANVGNLLLGRALARRKEMAIRSALGAGRSRVFQQLLVEAVLLALTGGVIGLLLTRAGASAAAALLADQVPRADELKMDYRVLLFALAASVVTGCLAGALPALRAGRADLNDALKEGGRQEGMMGVRTRRLLIVCEVALSVVLLMGAGVMLRSLAALRSVDAGYDPRNVLTMVVRLPQTRYDTPARVRAFFATAIERIRALPGVTTASAIDNLPTRGGSVQPIVVDGKPELLPRDQPTVAVRRVLPGYVHALDVPLVRGRDVAENDLDVILVSRSAAKLLWGDLDPIGRIAILPLESKMTVRRVVGIVGDVKQGELSEGVNPTVYEYTRENSFGNLTIVLRTSIPPLELVQPATGILRALDPEQPILNVRPMVDVVEETLSSQRFSTLLLGLFAALALALSTIGIYSVVSYIVRGRSREIGIRTALGARAGDVLRLVLREGMTPTLIGTAVGAAAALAASRVLARLVFGVGASDPLMLLAVVVVLALVALLASLLPAYRASRLDPVAVLRGE